MVDQVRVVPVVVVAVVLAQWAPDPSAPPSVPAPASVHSNRRVDVGPSVAAAAAMDVAMDLDPDPVDPVDPVDGAKAMEPELMPSQLAMTAMMASEPEMPLEARGGRGHRWLLVEFSGVSHTEMSRTDCTGQEALRLVKSLHGGKVRTMVSGGNPGVFPQSIDKFDNLWHCLTTCCRSQCRQRFLYEAREVWRGRLAHVFWIPFAGRSRERCSQSIKRCLGGTTWIDMEPFAKTSLDCHLSCYLIFSHFCCAICRLFADASRRSWSA